MRLDKYLTQSSLGTRKKVHKILADGKITVNGHQIFDATVLVDEKNVCVQYEGVDVVYKGCVSYMFHKPSGCISARRDGKHQTVLDYFAEDDAEGIFLVGRLDKETEGLLLLTNDGAFDHKLMDPDSHVAKKYYFEATGHLDQEAIERVQAGVMIWKNGPRTRPARLEQIENYEVGPSEMTNCSRKKVQMVRGYLMISEGKKHQVRRMLKSEGCEVILLRRIAVGGLYLDEGLKPGEYRELTIEEQNRIWE